MSNSIERFRELLTNYGPPWVSKVRPPVLHAIVATGLYSDGTYSDTYVRITDPWDRVVGSPGSPGGFLPLHITGSRYIMKWEDFVAEYEAAISGTPNVNLQILHSKSAIGRTANTGGSTPIGYAQSAGAAFTINWDEVELTRQPNEFTCWAAAGAMVVGWRDYVSLSPEGVAAICRRSSAHELTPADVAAFAGELGLTYENPVCYTPEGFRQILARNGPLWVVAAVPTLHAIVVTGMYSEGANNFVRICDPWDRAVGTPGSPGGYAATHVTGSRYLLKWEDFVAEYEGAAMGNISVILQIVQANGAGLHVANTGPKTPVGYAKGMSANAWNMAGYAASPARNGIFSQEQAGAIANLGPESTTGRRMPLQHHLTGEQNGVRWDLVQYDWLKSPARANPAGRPAVADGQQIDLGDWPFLPAADPKAILDERTRAPVRIDWRYQGGAVGDVRVTPGPFQTYDSWSIALAATVADGPDTPDVAELRVTVRTVFSKPGEANHVAVTSVTLFGDGRQPVREDAWEQPGVRIAA